MSTYSNQGWQPAKNLLWIPIVLGGIVWIGIVVWALMYSLERAEVVVAQGLIREPSSAQVIVAYASAVVFALPGAGLIVYGLARRRWVGGHRHDEVSQ